MSEKETDLPSNVTHIASRIDRINKEKVAIQEKFSPTTANIENFIQVLCFLRHMSISGDCELHLTADTLYLNMTHMVESANLNDYGTECNTAFTQTAKMVFDYDLDTITEPDRLEDATGDFLDILEGITDWMNPAVQS